MTEHVQPNQQAEPGQPQEPATKPADAELADEQLDEIAGGAGKEEYIKYTMSEVFISS